MRPLEQPIIHAVPPVAEAEYMDEMHDILKSAHYLPNQMICNCSMAQAWEVVYAIQKGARTMKDLAVATGIRSGCSIYCLGHAQLLLDAAGYPETPPENGSWHKVSLTLYNLDEHAVDHDPNLDLEKARSLAWSDENFEKLWADFATKMEARRNG